MLKLNPDESNITTFALMAENSRHDVPSRLCQTKRTEQTT